MLVTVRGKVVSAIDLVIWHFWVLFDTIGYHVLKEVWPVFENCAVFSLPFPQIKHRMFLMYSRALPHDSVVPKNLK